MTESSSATDLGHGLATFFVIVGVLAAAATAATAYVSEVGESAGMQILSGWAMAVALFAGGLAIVALHAYGR